MVFCLGIVLILLGVLFFDVSRFVVLMVLDGVLWVWKLFDWLIGLLFKVCVVVVFLLFVDYLIWIGCVWDLLVVFDGLLYKVVFVCVV